MRPVTLLERHAQTDLRPAAGGAVRAGRIRAWSRVVASVLERCATQIVLGRSAAGIVRRVEQIERFNLQVANDPLTEGQLLGETGIHLIDGVHIYVADRLEWHAAEPAAEPVQRTRHQRTRESIPGDVGGGVYRL